VRFETHDQPFEKDGFLRNHQCVGARREKLTKTVFEIFPMRKAFEKAFVCYEKL